MVNFAVDQGEQVKAEDYFSGESRKNKVKSSVFGDIFRAVSLRCVKNT